jgi:hypothetical protein
LEGSSRLHWATTTARTWPNCFILAKMAVYTSSSSRSHQRRFLLISWSAIVALLGFAYLLGSSPVARFEREQITILVHPDHVIVDGIYFYRNPFPFVIVQGLSVPLPADDTHPMPADLEVEELSPRPHLVGLRYIWGRPRFDLSIQGNETVCLHVHYYQQTPTSDARYILTTTQPWLQPLQTGEYRLISQGVTLLQSNYPLANAAGGVAQFKKTQFMPLEDWVFSWKAQ